jgi:hypothetical protein
MAGESWWLVVVVVVVNEPQADGLVGTDGHEHALGQRVEVDQPAPARWTHSEAKEAQVASSGLKAGARAVASGWW